MTVPQAGTGREPGWLKLQRAVFAACKAAGIDETARHDVVREATGHESLSDCNAADLGRVLNHLNRGREIPGRTQAKRRYEGRRRVAVHPSRVDQLAKIDALLAELHRVTGRVHPLRYADAIAKRHGWGECIEWCDARSLSNVIAALTRTLAYRIKNA